MAKRFIDTDMWEKNSFIESPARIKLLAIFMTSKCDLVGVFRMAPMLIKAYLGESYSHDDIMSIPIDVEHLEEGSYWLPKFCKFQYGSLSAECKPHKKYIEMLKEVGLIDRVLVGTPNHVKAVRKRLTQRIKDSIYSRDKYSCQYCGEKGLEVVVDHIKPVSKGGDNEDDNLITACVDCNSKKSDLHLQVFYDKFKDVKNLERVFNILERVYKNLNTLQDKDKEQDKDKDKEKDKDKDSENLQEFDLFRTEYQGKKRGNETEFDNFKKKTKDWKEVLPDLLALLRCQVNQRLVLIQASQFVPEWKNLSTWINQRCWEEVQAQASNPKKKSVFNTWDQDQ